MRPIFQVAVILAAWSLPLWAQDALPLVNPGFEDGLKGWAIPKDEGMCSLSTEQAASGKHSLKVVDKHPKNGSNATASRVPVSGAGIYELRGKVYPVSSTGLGIYVRVLDKDGKLLEPGDKFHRGLSGSEKRWQPFRLTIYAPEGTAFLEL